MALHARAWTVFGSLALLMLLAVAGVNAFDEALTPEASALFARQEAAFMPDSGWALMAGFHAPPGEDARAYGAAIHRAGLSRKPGQEAATPADALDVRAAEELLCNPQEMDCVRAFARRPESIAELVADNAVLLARYEDLMRSRQLLDVLGVLDYYVANGPHYSTVMRTQQAGLSKAGADVAKGHHAEAIAWLQADASFQRRWLDEAGSTLTKMIALRALSRDLLVTGQVARAAHGLSASEWQALERIAAPLSPTQRGFAPMLRAEASFFSQLLSEMRADSRRTSRIVEAPRLSAAIVAATIRPNATLNFAYPLFTDWMMLDAVPSAQLGAAIARVERRHRARRAPRARSSRFRLALGLQLHRPLHRRGAKAAGPRVYLSLARPRCARGNDSLRRCAAQGRCRAAGCRGVHCLFSGVRGSLRDARAFVGPAKRGAVVQTPRSE